MHPPDSFPGATDRTRATAPSGLPCIDSAGAALAERFTAYRGHKTKAMLMATADQSSDCRSTHRVFLDQSGGACRLDDLHDAVAHCVPDQIRYRMQVQLSHDVSAMGLRCFHTQIQHYSHFLACLALRQ